MSTTGHTPINALVVSIDELKACGFEAVIAGCDPTCVAYSQRLQAAAQAVGAPSELAQSRALHLLSAACQASLVPSDARTPFRPFFEFERRRGVIPTDLAADQVTALISLAETVQDHELAARLFDIGWAVRRNIECAKRAVTAYVASAKNPRFDKQWPERIERLERALRLARMINANESVTAPIFEELERFLLPSGDEKVSLGAQRAGQLLLEAKRESAGELARTLSALAKTIEVSDPHRARGLHLLAAKGYRATKDEAQAVAAEVRGAEMLLDVVEQHKQRGETMTAAHWMQQAVGALQKLPGQAERIQALQGQLEELNKASLAEMKPLRTEFDVSELAHKAVMAMRSATPLEALIRFAMLLNPLSRDKLEAQALERAQHAPIASRVPRSFYNGDGRLVAVGPPLSGCSEEERPAALRADVSQYLHIQHEAFVIGVILPARDELWRLHPLTQEHSAELFSNSPLFPPGHEELWIRGLFAGFEGEFDVALSLLIPQFEHALRKQLEARGEVVWRILPNGLHEERPLSALLDTEIAAEILGRDMQYELQNLLTEKVGRHLRTDVAHGLLPKGGFYSASGIYLWWLLFRLAVGTRSRTSARVLLAETTPGAPETPPAARPSG